MTNLERMQNIVDELYEEIGKHASIVASILRDKHENYNAIKAEDYINNFMPLMYVFDFMEMVTKDPQHQHNYKILKEVDEQVTRQLEEAETNDGKENLS